LLESIKHITSFVDNVKIPTRLKSKSIAHNKNITSLKFDSFGSNYITSGCDSYVKNWDACRSNKIKTITLIFYKH